MEAIDPVLLRGRRTPERYGYKATCMEINLSVTTKENSRNDTTHT